MTGGDSGDTRDGGTPKRLLDDAGMPRSEWAVDLLRSASPYQPPQGRKERVRLGLAERSSRRAPVWLRPAVAAAVLIGGGAIASAALGSWPGWIVRAYHSLVAPSAVSPPAPAPETKARPHVPVIAAPPPTAPAPPRTNLAAREPTPVARAARRGAPTATATTAADADRLVLEAMRALRLQHNPVRARALLSRYLDRHPNGALAEEALALSIEAAVAHQDADAAALAARYVRQYPRGPFHGLARQTLNQR